MAKRFVLQVVFKDKCWKVMSGTRVHLSLRLEDGFTNRDAVINARILALIHLPSQILIHRRDGVIHESRTYSRSPDPRRTKGGQGLMVYKIKAGDRVEMTDKAIQKGLDGSKNRRLGNVESVTADGKLRIKRDGLKSVTSWHPDYWKRVRKVVQG